MYYQSFVFKVSCIQHMQQSKYLLSVGFVSLSSFYMPQEMQK